MSRLFEVCRGVILDVPAAGHVGALETGPHRLSGGALPAAPLLWVQDGVVLGQSQPPYMFASIHVLEKSPLFQPTRQRPKEREKKKTFQQNIFLQKVLQLVFSTQSSLVSFKIGSFAS